MPCRTSVDILDECATISFRVSTGEGPVSRISAHAGPGVSILLLLAGSV